MEESKKEGYPTVLVIGSRPYLPQVQHFFDHKERPYQLRQRDPGEGLLDRKHGLVILDQDPDSNLGWRIVLEVDRPDFFERVIRASLDDPSKRLCDLVPRSYKDGVAGQLVLVEPQDQADDEKTADDGEPTIKLCSFEGAKGLSGQHVFVLGLHNGDLPRYPADIKDIEICKLLVALTRTRKQCHLLHTTRFAAVWKEPSEFLSWIGESRKEVVQVDSGYWQ